MTALLAVTVVGISAASLESAAPLPSGTSVVMFLDTSANLPDGISDMMVFTGGRPFLAELPGCSETALPLQDAVLIDQDGPRASRQIKVFLLSSTEPVPAGTRVKGFGPGVECESGGIVYKKYTGTVE